MFWLQIAVYFLEKALPALKKEAHNSNTSVDDYLITAIEDLINDYRKGAFDKLLK